MTDSSAPLGHNTGETDLPPQISSLEIGALALFQFLVEMSFYSGLVHLMCASRTRAAYLAAKRYIDRVAGVVLSGLGVRLLAET